MLVAVVAMWAAYIFSLHTFAGQRLVAREVYASPLPPLVRTTFTVVWHVTSIVLAGIVVTVATYPWSARAFDMAVVHVAAFGVLFLIVAQHAGAGLRTPQWMLFGPLLLAMLGLRFAIPYVAPLLLTLIALVHVAWPVGIAWPAPSRASAGAYLMGREDRVSLRAPSIAVALCLLALALAVAAGFTWARWLCVSVFALRFVIGMVERRLRPGIITTPYAWLSLGFYSPLCLFIAMLAAVGA